MDRLLVPPPLEFADGRVSLRSLTLEDWPIEVALSAVEDVVRWTRYPPRLDEDGARARIGTRIARAIDGTGTRYTVTDQPGRILGTAGIAMNDQQVPEVFYALLPAGRGRGLATAATRQLTCWALGVGHPVVALKTSVGNTASEAVATRCGFTARGVEQATVRDAVVRLRRWERTAGDPATR